MPTLTQCQGCISADMTPTHVNNVIIGKSTDTSLNDLLFHLPVIPEVQYVGLMKKYHLHKLVRLLSRVLPKIMNQEVLNQIGYKVSDIEDNRIAIGKSEKPNYELLPSEHQSLIYKLAFLMLVKSSNRIHWPKKGGIVNGISLLETRYRTEAM